MCASSRSRFLCQRGCAASRTHSFVLKNAIVASLFPVVGGDSWTSRRRRLGGGRFHRALTPLRSPRRVHLSRPPRSAQPLDPDSQGPPRSFLPPYRVPHLTVLHLAARYHSCLRRRPGRASLASQALGCQPQASYLELHHMARLCRPLRLQLGPCHAPWLICLAAEPLDPQRRLRLPQPCHCLTPPHCNLCSPRARVCPAWHRAHSLRSQSAPGEALLLL